MIKWWLDTDLHDMYMKKEIAYETYRELRTRRLESKLMFLLGISVLFAYGVLK